MKRTGFVALLLLFFFAHCGPKKSAQAGADTVPFPVVSYLQSQVRHVDTSLYSIVKIRKANGVTDTAYLRREDFKTAAVDFLSLPDISSEEWRGKYAETKLYDEDLKKVVITYEPKDKKEDNRITRQDVIIEPGSGAGDQVQTIYIETVLNNKDSAVQKKMTWNVNRSFQVIKLINRKNQPEAVETMDITWSDGH
jgi:hypothetical protein